MSWLTDNPIVNLRGEEFLLFYAAVVTATSLTVWYLSRGIRNERGARREVPPVPTSPDPYRVAYLRGGINEVVRAVIFELHRRGILKVTGKQDGVARGKREKMERTGVRLPATGAPTLEARVYDYFATPRTPAEVFYGNGALAKRLAPECAAYQTELESEGLLMPPAVLFRLGWLHWFGWLVILGLGIWKLIVALGRGHSNVGYLIALMIGGLVAVAILSQKRRLTRLGRAYLKSLQTTYSWARFSAKSGSRVAGADMTLAMAIFGVSVLPVPEFLDYRNMYSQSSTSGCGAGCGGSSGSGGDGGDGGGGGCGGCGGGGD